MDEISIAATTRSASQNLDRAACVPSPHIVAGDTPAGPDPQWGVPMSVRSLQVLTRAEGKLGSPRRQWKLAAQ